MYKIKKFIQQKTGESIRCLFILLITFSTATIAGSWQQNVTIGGFNKVHIYTPDTLSAIGNGQALLIVLHGCVQPIDNYLTANLETAAETYGMVIAVPDSMNKAGFSCWSYWQGAISRTAGDYKNLISLANTLSSDVNRTIDAQQVYIAGLSSGAAMSAQTACLAPTFLQVLRQVQGPLLAQVQTEQYPLVKLYHRQPLSLVVKAMLVAIKITLIVK